MKSTSSEVKSQRSHNKWQPFGVVGAFTIAVALLYGIWAGVMAYSVNGQLGMQVVQKMLVQRGIDMTDPAQINTALQSLDFSNELSAARKETLSNWFIVRHCSMLVLSLLVVLSLLRRWSSSTTCLAVLAISVPASMTFLIIVSGGELSGKIGMLINSTIGGLFWLVLWWLHRRTSTTNPLETTHSSRVDSKTIVIIIFAMVAGLVGNEIWKGFFDSKVTSANIQSKTQNSSNKNTIKNLHSKEQVHINNNSIVNKPKNIDENANPFEREQYARNVFKYDVFTNCLDKSENDLIKSQRYDYCSCIASVARSYIYIDTYNKTGEVHMISGYYQKLKETCSR